MLNQKPSQCLNVVQRLWLLMGLQAAPTGIKHSEQSPAGSVYCSLETRGGVDERRRSGGQEKTKTLSAVRHVVFSTHERI